MVVTVVLAAHTVVWVSAAASLSFCAMNSITMVCSVPRREAVPPSPRETTAAVKRRGRGRVDVVGKLEGTWIWWAPWSIEKRWRGLLEKEGRGRVKGIRGINR
jgi:hypothetical protein